MLKQLIIGKFSEVVKKTISKYQDKYKDPVQIFLKTSESIVIVDIMANYKYKESIRVSDLDIPLISSNTVENKILNALENLRIENKIGSAQCLLFINNDKLISYLYNNNKPIKKIELLNIL